MPVSNQTISKSIIKSLGRPPSDFTDLENIEDLLKKAYVDGLLTLPVLDYNINIISEGNGALINFLNLSIYQSNGRSEKVTRKTLNNFVLNALDSYPDSIILFIDKTLPQGKNIFIGMRSSKPILKKYVNPLIRGGIIMSSLEPNDKENNGKTSIFQFISFDYFKTQSDFIIRD
jgi:hypothetical protein